MPLPAATSTLRLSRRLSLRLFLLLLLLLTTLSHSLPTTTTPTASTSTTASTTASTSTPTSAYDAIIYDASSGGVTAAVSAARRGLHVALLCASWPGCFPEGGQRVGGMSSGGLGQTDIGPTASHIGGLALEFYQRNRAHYGPALATKGAGSASASPSCRLPSAGCNETYNLEPHVAQAIFTDMLREAGVDVHFSAQVDKVYFVAKSAAPPSPSPSSTAAASSSPASSSPASS